MSEADKGRILLAVTGFNPKRWYELLSQERTVVTEPEGARDPSIRYAVVWKQKPNLLSTLPNLRAIFSIGAGVDHLFVDPGLPDVPIVRVVAENLTQYMREYIVWRVLDHHRQGTLYRGQQPRKVWHEPYQPTAGEVSVGIMGMGHLGRAAAAALVQLGFRVNGWTRTERPMEGVSCWHGRDGLSAIVEAEDGARTLGMECRDLACRDVRDAVCRPGADVDADDGKAAAADQAGEIVELLTLRVGGADHVDALHPSSLRRPGAALSRHRLWQASQPLQFCETSVS